MMLFPIHQVIFYVFAVIVIASAVMVITSQNPIKSVLFLVVTFFASAVLWMLMQAEFLSLVLIFVYVGAVMTLFLFVVMMLRIDADVIKIGFKRAYPLGILAFLLFVGITLYVLSPSHWSSGNTLPVHYDSTYQNIMVMGDLLFTKYLFDFELAAVILLIGMVSAIALAFYGKKPDVKTQKIAKQLEANKKDRLKLV